jgi:hypothetical protein
MYTQNIRQMGRKTTNSHQKTNELKIFPIFRRLEVSLRSCRSRQTAPKTKRHKYFTKNVTNSRNIFIHQ